MLNTSAHTEDELLYAISKGDTSAFAQLFYLHKNQVYAIALKISNSPGLAEDIVQEVFTRIWTARDRLSEVSNLNAWINTITRNCLFTWLKKKAKVEVLELDEKMADNDHTEKTIDYKEADAIIKKALNQLPPQQHKVYILIKESGMKREEVAAQLNLSPETVKIHLSKALKSIRAFYLSNTTQVLALLILNIF